MNIENTLGMKVVKKEKMNWTLEDVKNNHFKNPILAFDEFGAEDFKKVGERIEYNLVKTFLDKDETYCELGYVTYNHVPFMIIQTAGYDEEVYHSEEFIFNGKVYRKAENFLLGIQNSIIHEIKIYDTEVENEDLTHFYGSEWIGF